MQKKCPECNGKMGCGWSYGCKTCSWNYTMELYDDIKDLKEKLKNTQDWLMEEAGLVV